MAVNIDLEHIHTDDGALARNFDKLRALVPDTGGHSIGIRFGTQTLTWAGGTTRTGSPVISHGLGKAPVVVFPSCSSPSGTWFPVLVVDTFTATSFTTRGVTSDGSSPGAGTTTTAYWLAIG